MSNSLDGARYGMGNGVVNASRQVWLAGLGAAVVTREWAGKEAGHVFRTLVREGSAVESKAIRVVGERIESTLTQATHLIRRARHDVQSAVTGYAGSAIALVNRMKPAKPQAARTASRKQGTKVLAKSAAKRTVKRGTRRAVAR